MSEGDILKQKELTNLSIFEFWSFYDRFNKKKEKELENLKSKKNGR